ncbi:MAG: permease [Candidatus Micrarchaeota archaeon]|nr:permease [Candidatus Micrarchaeota archaeon]
MLKQFADWLVYSILGVPPSSSLGAALNFFIYDSIKVTALLAIVIFAVALVRSFITPKKVQKWLGGKREGAGNVLAALLGIPTPFCSCSAVPLFIGFVEAGVPLGVTFSFLIASPLINEIAATMLFAMFGWEIALLYILSGFAIAVAAGIIIGRLKLEKEVEPFARGQKAKTQREKRMDWRQRINFAAGESKRITLRVLPFLLFGIAVGALIHGYAPSDLLAGIAGKDNPLAVPIAVLVGIPLYSNAAGMVPIVGVLISKGVAVGTALAFMMSVIGLSLPEMIILRKVLKPKLLAAFAIILFAAFVLTGYIFNILLS